MWNPASGGQNENAISKEPQSIVTNSSQNGKHADTHT